MKKKLLILVVMVMAIALCLSLAGVASAATITTSTDYYIGDYANIFAGRSDEAELKAEHGTQAVIVFGQLADYADGEYEYGVILYPVGEAVDAGNAMIFPAKGCSDDGKFGIAVSISQSFINSGDWNAITYVKDADAPLTYENCITDKTNVISINTQTLAAPASISVDNDGIVTWGAVDGAQSYNISLQWIKDGVVHYDYAQVANVTTTSWDVNAWLGSLTISEIEKYNGLRPAMKVTAVGANGLYGEPVILANALGTDSDGGNFALYVISDKEDLTNIASHLGNKYAVLTQDIDLGNVAGDLTQTGTYGIFGQFNKGSINGLGHTIKYTLDGDDSAAAAGSRFYGLFSSISLTDDKKIKDLTIDATIYTYTTIENYNFNVLAQSINSTAKIEDCFFKVRGQTKNATKNNWFRLNVISGAKPTFTNCVFDMASYRSDGTTMYVPGYDESRGSTVSSTQTGTISNCVFIANQENVTNWTCSSSTTVSNSSIFADYGYFCEAWTNDTLVGKANYQAAGWNVTSENGYMKVTFNGVTVADKVFNPCITTAEQFMLLGTLEAGRSVYLGANIDLSSATWSSKTGTYDGAANAELAFLIETLNCSLDGKGYKVTVRYDHDIEGTATDTVVRMGGLFGTVSSSAKVENLALDIELKYYGPTGEDGASDTETGKYAMHNSALCHTNSGTIQNNYVKARFYADNYVKRESIISNAGGTTKANIVDVEVYKANAKQDFGTYAWSNTSNDTTNTVISATRTTAPTTFVFYNSTEAFITAWNEDTFSLKSSYSTDVWTVDSTAGTISLCGKEVASK